MAEKKKLPYMRFHISDYLADTGHLSTVQHGAYLRLLLLMWDTRGSIPADADWIRHRLRITVAEYNRHYVPVLDEFCKRSRNRWTQKRLAREYRETSDFYAKQRRNGRKAHSHKYLKEGENTVGGGHPLKEEQNKTNKKKTKQTHPASPSDLWARLGSKLPSTSPDPQSVNGHAEKDAPDD